MNMPQPTDRRELLQQALRAIDDLQARLDRTEQERTEPIAIIGMSCRFPGGADTPEAYWSLLRDGVDAVTEAPADRWDTTRVAPDPDAHYPGGYLKQLDHFDPQFFGISPREAATLDPQQRLLLEVSWEALERAGLNPDGLTGSKTGVFIGITATEYGYLAFNSGPTRLDIYTATGTALNTAAGRIAYTLGLQGPCLAVDTACSSSLVAIHLACQSLRNRESDMALTGGVNVILRPDAFTILTDWGTLSADGRCKTFDARADGFVRGEGCGIVVLKRLSDAIANRDQILAVIHGSAVNQDGRSGGLTVPNGLAQQAVVRQALASARLDPSAVSYVEAHGTGTPLGDPIEVEALGTVFGAGRPADSPLVIGSAKANLGHLESASGVAGLIKIVLSLQNGEIPRQLHFETPNPRIAWDELPVKVSSSPTSWQRNGTPRIAGISGFGFSGTNAHLLIGESPVMDAVPVPVERPRHVLTLSARSDAGLIEIARRFAANLEAPSAASLADLCYTANTGRSHMRSRLAAAASTSDELRAKLTAFVNGDANAVFASQNPGSPRPRVAFLFTGQGSQYVGMGRRLYETQPLFRETLDRCVSILDRHLPGSLLDVMFAADPGDARINQTGWTQPALFAFQVALAAVWRSWGVQPSAVLGHSIGSLAAAHIAGAISLEDACRLVATRGQLMQALPAGGTMAAIVADEQTVAAALAGRSGVGIGAVNAPTSIVVSGEASSVEALIADLEGQGVQARRLTVSHAFHSHLMDPMLGPLQAEASTVSFAEPGITFVSDLTGQVAGRADLAAPNYWTQHARQAVRFAAGIATVAELGCDTFIEIGPHPTLLGLGSQCISAADVLWLPSLRRNADDWQPLLDSVSKLYARGADIDWAGFDRDAPRVRVPLPTSPFERKRYWLPPATSWAGAVGRGVKGRQSGLLGRRIGSPLLRETLYESQVSAQSPAYLNDHRLFGTAVFPGSGYVEMAVQAAASLGTGDRVVEGLSIQQPLFLPEEDERTVQLLLSPSATDRATFKIVSFPEGATPSMDDASAFAVHASGVVRVDVEQQLASRGEPVSQLRTRIVESVTVSEYYESLQSLGLEYGETFRGISELWRKDGEALGHVVLPDAAGSDLAAFQIHPGLLDACFQVLGAAMPRRDTDEEPPIFVPIGLDALRVFEVASGDVWCHATVDADVPADASVIQANLRLIRDEVVVAELRGLQLGRASRESLRLVKDEALSDHVYEIVWRSAALASPVSDPTPESAGAWLVLADEGGTGTTLAARLTERGDTCLLVEPDAGDLREQISRTLRENRLPLKGMVHLSSLDVTAADGVGSDRLDRARLRTTTSILSLVQAAADDAANVPLWVVTRGAQRVGDDDAATVALQATTWGLTRVVANEHPTLRPRLIDLDPSERADTAPILLQELLGGDQEDQIVWRADQRYAARLARATTVASGDSGDAEAHGPRRLEIVSRGKLDSITLNPLARRAPQPHEVEIEVEATGLNFRDVLNVLGMYPGDPGQPGLECTGKVVAVGSEVISLRPGDAVFGIAPEAFNTYVVTPADLVVARPDSLSAEEAATVPIAFLTAIYGLQGLAHLTRGDRVLIHAAAGGVGQAAVQIAQRIGAEVYATVGSPAKRAVLEAMGVKHIFNSRTLDFADEIMQVTAGRGVDVVLNSLSDDFIGKSVSVLAPHGRFLDIGKRGVWTNEQMAAVRPDVKYWLYDLGDLLGGTSTQLTTMLHELSADLASGAYRPLPYHTFPMRDIVSAFRFMAQAKHIGKVVVTHEASAHRDAPERPQPFTGEGTYLVTGGLGALGLRLAAWMAEQGASHIVLTGRRGPDATAESQIAQIRATGAEVLVCQADVADRASLTGLLSDLRQTLPPLRGVFHAAGVLDDGMLAQQTADRFANVLRPKVEGSLLLDELTRGNDLEQFVLFSSASAILGSAGQGAYAAGNAFLDALAQARCSAGLPALSVNWGGWGEIGMAANLDARQQRRMRDRGVMLIDPQEGLDLLGTLLRRAPAQVAVLPTDWPKLLAQYGRDAVPVLLSEMQRAGQSAAAAGTGSATSAAETRRRLQEIAAEDRPAALLELLTVHLCRVLGLPGADAVDPARSLSDHGLDSLLAVELRNGVESELGYAPPIGHFIAGASVMGLAIELAEQFGLGGADAAGGVALQPADQAALPDAAEIAELTDDEVNALLESMLAQTEVGR